MDITSTQTNNELELWGGIECTINRVNDNYFDQLEFSGHYNRNDDIENIAQLGIKALRYPVLWEKHEPVANKNISWSFMERNLNKLRALNIRPIIGLVHHGSGPKHVNFFDGSFEKGLAEYSYKVAQQFPWVEYYTPVNEPLTTARFCGLYGHWYPHKRDGFSFAKILLSECKATIMAMQKIREVNPDAKLIQTEDLTRIYSTPLLKYQADFENNRRWLAFDLISGKVVEKHPLHGFLLLCGITQNELDFFLENPCPPDVIGLNYYLTSERFLDEKIENYPEHTHGSNGKHCYADVEAVRINFNGMYGAQKLLSSVWERFNIPIAVTEVHLHCHREEQLRWFYEIWQTAKKLKDEGVNIRAVTAWALLGSFGWNKLLTGEEWEYEPGVFDVRSGKLRWLATAEMISHLARNKALHHPVLSRCGWWHRHSRFIYNIDNNNLLEDVEENKEGCKPLLIIGDHNLFSNYFAELCKHRNIYYKLIDNRKQELNEKYISEYHPWAIVFSAEYMTADHIETTSNIFSSSDYSSILQLVKYCNTHNIQLVMYSLEEMSFHKNFVSYFKHGQTVSVYNPNRLTEQSIQQDNPETLIIRMGLAAKDCFDDTQLATYLKDVINASVDLLIDKQSGVWHIQNLQQIMKLNETTEEELVA